MTAQDTPGQEPTCGHQLPPAPATNSGQAEPLVSVVIPTRNRSDLLREVIDSLWAQHFDLSRVEIIVLDNLSTDDTPAVMAELLARSPCRLVYYRMPENRGPAHSRNTGVQLARGPIIAFTDSDCRVSPDWLARGLPVFADPKVAFVTGTMLDKPGQPVRFFARTNSGVTSEHPTYPTCNAMFRRDAILEVGGFDESLCFVDLFNRPAECADTDLAWRIKERGWGNVFVPEMIVYHEVEMLTPLNWMREPFRLYVVPALVRRHPELRRRLLKWRFFFYKLNVAFYLAVLGLGLACWHLAFALLAVPFLAWAATAGIDRMTLARLPRIPPRMILLSIRQAYLCGGLLYGSVRFRTLVL